MSTSYTLAHFQQNFDDPYAIDVVRCAVRIWSGGVPIGMRDVALSSAALTEAAETQGRPTWDERDVAFALAEKVGAVVYIAEPTPTQPTPTDTPPPTVVFKLPEPTQPTPTAQPWYRKFVAFMMQTR